MWNLCVSAGPPGYTGYNAYNIYPSAQPYASRTGGSDGQQPAAYPVPTSIAMDVRLTHPPDPISLHHSMLTFYPYFVTPFRCVLSD